MTTKKDLFKNLKSCFPDKYQVSIKEIAEWVGKRTAIQAHKYADENNIVKLK